MSSRRTASIAAAVLCLLLPTGCAKQDEQPAPGAQRSTASGAAGATTENGRADARPEQGAKGAPNGQGQGEAKGGPIGGGSKSGTALASPITIPAIQQQGQPVDDDVRYPGGVIGFVEDLIRDQCADGTLCGFTVTAVRHEPDTAPEPSAERDYCAYIQGEEQKESVTYTEPATVALNCVWHYTEPDDSGPVPDPDPPPPPGDPATPGASTTATTPAGGDTE
ncbi:hypothetical protein [Mycolicibacterium neworleansense]|uniref:Secreted protein n=1 Tax=Mycolicibacterium neworleansense TaxID=146018 RepID=A0A0H5S7R8_9MYCO|nr:hypothetical protein [Mycolicibacterium neworleansense]CRZ17284.1 hypothetical protein BN2156_04169 [Mycolicibacterium neworleansense]